MIKILHIVSTIGKSSGVMNVIMNYYSKIYHDIQFDFLYFSEVENDFSKEIKQYGGNIYNIGKPYFSISYSRKVKNFFKNHYNQYKAIHCHPLFSYIFFANHAKVYGINHVIQHSHTTQYSNKKISAIRNYIIIKLSRFFVTDYIACSKNATIVFPKCKRESSFILNNAIDSKKYMYNPKSREKIRQELNIPFDYKVIGHIGRFSSEKNHKELLRIFKLYHYKEPKSVLVLVGDGKLKQEILCDIKKLDLESSIIMTGIRNDVNVLLSSFDFFILPSIFEGFGIVAIEAQASGLMTYCSLGVPNVAIITKLAKKFDVNTEKEFVVDDMLRHSEYKRENMCECIKKACFDIDEEAKKLKAYYKSLK